MMSSAAPTSEHENNVGDRMSRFLQLTFDGLATGAIYALLALALVLIYRATGMVNLAQGEMAMFSTYLAWQFTAWGLPLVLAVGAAAGVSFAMGLAIYLLLIRPVAKESDLTIIIMTLGIFLALNSSAGWIWTPTVRSFPSMFSGETQSIGPLRATPTAIGTILVLFGLLLLLNALFHGTRIGLAMRAAAFNRESSALSGIPVSRMLALGWGIAAAFGSFAGVLVAPKLFLDPMMMFGVLFYAVAAATLGGVDSLLGSVLAGLGIGVSENLAGSYIGFIGTDLKILVPLTLVVIGLLFFPNGLFGGKVSDRV